jgi:hypothetical protein
MAASVSKPVFTETEKTRFLAFNQYRPGIFALLLSVLKTSKNGHFD